MNNHERVAEAIYAAIDEVNAKPGIPKRVGKSPDTVLVGENAELDSLFFVEFVTAVEDGVQRTCDTSIAVMELFTEEMESSCTVAELVRRVIELVDGG